MPSLVLDVAVQVQMLFSPVSMTLNLGASVKKLMQNSVHVEIFETIRGYLGTYVGICQKSCAGFIRSLLTGIVHFYGIEE